MFGIGVRFDARHDGGSGPSKRFGLSLCKKKTEIMSRTFSRLKNCIT
jgi:hypothetical protein